ncbi:hypothetical protein EDB83DRAFT_2387474 [Lactarius deliciosus]|nr:hypothetical protein EDB83DRAFT_2387474 [Lactarius deliciosus]
MARAQTTAPAASRPTHPDTRRRRIAALAASPTTRTTRTQNPPRLLACLRSTTRLHQAPPRSNITRGCTTFDGDTLMVSSFSDGLHIISPILAVVLLILATCVKSHPISSLYLRACEPNLSLVELVRYWEIFFGRGAPWNVLIVFAWQTSWQTSLQSYSTAYLSDGRRFSSTMLSGWGSIAGLTRSFHSPHPIPPLLSSNNVDRCFFSHCRRCQGRLLARLVRPDGLVPPYTDWMLLLSQVRR